MRFHSITKNLMLIFFLISIFCIEDAMYAEVLSFKVGDKASYTISQKANAEIEICGVIIDNQAEATIDLDIEILSVNKQTSSYPFEVKVTLKRIFSTEVKNGDSITYDSNSLITLKNSHFAKHLNKLINYPLNFRVEKGFQVEETTGYLYRIDDYNPHASFIGLFGVTPWTFELLLTQLFHLSGKNLLVTNAYPVSCYQFLNWEYYAIDILNEFGSAGISVLHQSSAYMINSMDSKKIEASWLGNAKVESAEDVINGDVFVGGNVTWDIANPMIQKRDLEVRLEATSNGIFPGHAKISVQQTWETTAY